MSLLRLIGLARAEEPAPAPAAGVNARRHGRVKCEGLNSSIGEILDMSASGTRVALRRKLDLTPGDVVELTLEMLDVCVRLNARVVWKRRISARRSEVGLEFLGLTDDVREVLAMVGRSASMNQTLRPENELQER